MQIIRLTAKSKEKDPKEPQTTFTLVCGLEGETISEGEWYGQMKRDGYLYPFVCERGAKRLLYGWDEHYRESTNIGSRAIKVGGYFVTGEAEGQGEPWSLVFQITAIHSYASP